MTQKQLIVVIESTAALGPYWQTVLRDYLENIIRCFSDHDAGEKKSSNVELALVTFNANGFYSGCLIQRSGWTRNVDVFLQWLSSLPFIGGGLNDVAIAEGLSEALMMFSETTESESQQMMEVRGHCVLVAASNPRPLPIPAFWLPMQNYESEAECLLSDAETIATFFPKRSISLSVVGPKKLPKLRAIYNAAKCTSRGADPMVENTKNPHFLVLISENFAEALAVLCAPGVINLPPKQNALKIDVASVPAVTGPSATSISPVNGCALIKPSISNNAMVPVKTEPSAVSSMTDSCSLPNISSQVASTLQNSSPSSTNQDLIASGEILNDMKPTINGLPQTLRAMAPSMANVSILNSLSQARQVMNSAALAGGSIGVPSMNVPISCVMPGGTAPAQNVVSSGQPIVTSLKGLGNSMLASQNMGLSPLNSASSTVHGNSNLGNSVHQMMGNSQIVNGGQSGPVMVQGNISGVQIVQNGIAMNSNMMTSGSGQSASIVTSGTGVQSLAANSNAVASLPASQPTNPMHATQSKYVKVWEGNLSGQRQGHPVLITRLEGYRNASASEMLAVNWPPTMQIVRLISQDHMNNKQYVGKADFLVFRAMNQHGFLGQLQEKKLCAVIQLPSQTLLLSVSDKACRLIGMLFPGDMVVFKPQVSSQQQQIQAQQQMQAQQQQQIQAQQQMQAQQQQQQAQSQRQDEHQQLQAQHQHQQQMQVEQTQQHSLLPQQQPQMLQPQQQQMLLPQQQQLLQPQQQQMLQPQQQQQQQMLQSQQQQQQQMLQSQQQQQQLALTQSQQPQSLQSSQGTVLGQNYVQGSVSSKFVSQAQV